MDGPERSQPTEETGESTIPTSLAPDLFAYIKVNLKPVYEAQLADATEEDLSQKLEKFHTSRLGRLGNQFKRFKEQEDIPDDPSLELSEQDIPFIQDTIGPPISASAVEMMEHKGRMEALKMAFEKAQKSQGKSGDLGFLDKLRSKFKS